MNYSTASDVVNDLRLAHNARLDDGEVPSYGQTFRVVFNSGTGDANSRLASTIAATLKLDIPEMSLGLANCRVVVSDTFAEALQKESVFETYAGGKIPVFAVVPSTVLDMLVKEKAETPLEIDEANKKDQLTILISPRIEGGQLVCGILHDEHLRIAYGGRKEVLLEKEQLQGFLRNLLTVVQNGIVDNLGSRASWCSRLLDRVATPYPLDARVLHENTRWMLNDLDFRDNHLLERSPLLKTKSDECRTKLKNSRMLFVHGTRAAANILAHLAARLTLEESAKKDKAGYRFLTFFDATKAMEYELLELGYCAFVLSNLDVLSRGKDTEQGVLTLLKETIPNLVGKLSKAENFLIITSRARSKEKFIKFIQRREEPGEILTRQLLEENSIVLDVDECSEIESFFCTRLASKGRKPSSQGGTDD